jgi:hypothetical protein
MIPMYTTDPKLSYRSQHPVRFWLFACSLALQAPVLAMCAFITPFAAMASDQCDKNCDQFGYWFFSMLGLVGLAGITAIASLIVWSSRKRLAAACAVAAWVLIALWLADLVFAMPAIK